MACWPLKEINYSDSRSIYLYVAGTDLRSVVQTATSVWCPKVFVQMSALLTRSQVLRCSLLPPTDIAAVSPKLRHPDTARMYTSCIHRPTVPTRHLSLCNMKPPRRTYRPTESLNGERQWQLLAPECIVHTFCSNVGIREGRKTHDIDRVIQRNYNLKFLYY